MHGYNRFFSQHLAPGSTHQPGPARSRTHQPNASLPGGKTHYMHNVLRRAAKSAASASRCSAPGRHNDEMELRLEGRGPCYPQCSIMSDDVAV